MATAFGAKNVKPKQAPKPFASTPLGIAINTVRGLPKAAVDVGKTILRESARSVGSAGLTIAEPFGGRPQLTPEDLKSEFGSALYETVFGKAPLNTIQTRIAESELSIQKSPLAKELGVDKFALPLAFGGIMGSTVLDLTPFGGSTKTAKTILSSRSTDDIFKLFVREGVPEDIAKTFAPRFAKLSTPKAYNEALDLMQKTMGVKFVADFQTKNLPVQVKLLNAVRAAAEPREELEAVYTLERSKRAAEVAKVFQEGKGQAGYYEALSKLKGSLTDDPKFPVLKLEEKDVQDLFNMVQQSRSLSVYDSLTASHGLNKLLEGVPPTRGELALLEDVFGSALVKEIDSKRSTWAKIGTATLDVLNLPRTLITTFDMSAPLRQGILFVTKPVAFSKALGQMFRGAFSAKNYNEWLDNVTQHPFYNEMRSSGLYIADTRKKAVALQEREEAFISRFLQNRKFLGLPVRFSERAYVGFLNKLRVDVFTTLTTRLKEEGIATPTNLKALANYVNISTGRGSLGALNKVAPVLSTTFFAPRYMAARFQALNPQWYASMPSPIRKEALKNMAKFIGFGSTILALGSLGGANVELDPRSSDFGKMRLGNTTLDIWGGFQQWVRVYTQLATGERKSIGSGNITELTGEGFTDSRFDVALRFLRGKLAPIPLLATELLDNQKLYGGDVTLTSEIVENTVPLYLQDMAELIDEQGGKALFIAPLGFFGVGIQTIVPDEGGSGKAFGGGGGGGKAFGGSGSPGKAFGGGGTGKAFGH